MDRTWISKCLQDRASRRRVAQRTFKPPTRVIDVESQEPRLYTASPIDKNTKYITLSHCWGDAHVLKLKTSNHHTLENSIPIDSLPQTFCDAITIARKLGFKYL